MAGATAVRAGVKFGLACAIGVGRGRVAFSFSFVCWSRTFAFSFTFASVRAVSWAGVRVSCGSVASASSSIRGSTLSLSALVVSWSDGGGIVGQGGFIGAIKILHLEVGIALETPVSIKLNHLCIR